MSREENRARMPMVTAFVDAMRAEFGEDCKVIYASENGLTLGTPMPRIEGVSQPQSIQSTTPSEKIRYAYALRRKKGW